MKKTTPIEKLYNTVEAAEMLNCTKRNIIRLCKSGKIAAFTVQGNGGEQYRIKHSALLDYAQKNNIKLIIPEEDGVCNAVPHRSNSLTLLPVQVDEHTHLPAQGLSFAAAGVKQDGFPALPENRACATHSLVPNKREAVPTKAKEIAYARQDVLALWEDFRAQAEKKTNADNDFIAAFNSGILAPELYKKLGSISKASLYRWKKELCERGTLVPQYKYGSMLTKATKLSEVEKKYFMDLMLQPNKVTVGAAHRLISFALAKQGITEICSRATYERYANWFKSTHADVWTLMRGGEKALLDNVAPYIKRDASLLEVGDVLIADGHVLDFQVINPFNGKPCRAMLVGYFDWKSSDLAGYEIMLTENTQCIASALRNAILNLGKIPKCCYQDNGRAFRAKFFEGTKSFEECGFIGLFGKLGIAPVFAKPYNARAKVIERFFREFSETCEKLLPSYVGNSPINKPAYMMRNEKFHKAIHNEFIPTIEQAHKLIASWLEFYRSQPCPHVKGQTIGEVFRQGCGDGVDIDILDDLMLASESRKIGRNGVKFLGSHYFSQELYGITEKVEIRYSLYDLSSIKIYSLKGDYLGVATTVLSVHPMANILGDQKDVYSLKKAIRDNKKLQNETMRKAKQLLPRLEKHLDWQKEIPAEPIPLITTQNEKKVAKIKDYLDYINYDDLPQPKVHNRYEL